MSLSRVIVSWYVDAWKQAHGSLACVSMILRKGMYECTVTGFNTISSHSIWKGIYYIEKKAIRHYSWFTKVRLEMGLEVLECNNLRLSLQVCRLWMHVEHQECPFPPWWPISGRHYWRKTLPCSVPWNEGWLQYGWHWTFGGYPGKNHSDWRWNNMKYLCESYSRCAFMNWTFSFRCRTVTS